MQMPIFDFALIEVVMEMYSTHHKYNFKFEQMVRPICLPASRRKRKSSFLNQISIVSGYGRVEAKKIPGKVQTPLRLMKADLRIIGNDIEICSNVKFSYI